jgi:hypothetical protein
VVVVHDQWHVVSLADRAPAALALQQICHLRLWQVVRLRDVALRAAPAAVQGEPVSEALLAGEVGLRQPEVAVRAVFLSAIVALHDSPVRALRTERGHGPAAALLLDVAAAEPAVLIRSVARVEPAFFLHVA